MVSIDLRRRDPWGAALLAIALVHGLLLSPLLVYDDLNLHYPFLTGDAHDWIANALWWTGKPVRFSARPPLFPWLLASLERLSLLPLAPLLNQLAIAGGIGTLTGCCAAARAPPGRRRLGCAGERGSWPGSSTSCGDIPTTS